MQRSRPQHYRWFILLLIAAFCSTTWLSLPRAAHADTACSDGPSFDSSGCIDDELSLSEDFITADENTDQGTDNESNVTYHHIKDEEIPAIEKWLSGVFTDDLQPWLQSFTTQMSAAAMQQTFMFGTLLDAKEQMEVQRLFQRLTAEAHKDYQPSTGVCTIGTTVRSLASAQEFAEFNARALARAGLVRGTGNIDTAATEGEQSDRAGRLEDLRNRYCDQSDNNSGLATLCTQTTATAVTVNRDIDYAGVMEKAPTLDIDLTTGNVGTDDARDVTALANNLYGHQALYRIPESAFDQDKTRILDFRSVMAQRNVASASFYTIAGLKSHGSPKATTGSTATGNSNDTAQYMKVLLKELGVADADIPTMLGDRPSYDAQMEVLTKKIYQNPAFYSELYETPANVLRKKVALQAIGLMQDFDTLQSYLRTEMMLSQLLELEVLKQQDNVQNEIGRLASSGETGGGG